MRPVAVMVALSVATWFIVSWLVDQRARSEVLFGMLGPLALACGSWVVIERTVARNRQMLMSLMVAAFAFKLLFVGVYVVVMLRVAGLRPAPFALSLTGYFSGLYLIEALYLRRLFR
jgi:uncharacterized membrane protein YozB (DUF420 family)